MKLEPQSTWDRDPEGTYRKMNAEIDRDVAAGYIIGSEITRFRNAANKCYLAAKRRQPGTPRKPSGRITATGRRSRPGATIRNPGDATSSSG